MIRHRERSPWLPFFQHLSDSAPAILHAAHHIGGYPLAKLAQMVIDDARLRQEPTKRMLAAIEELLRHLEDGSSGQQTAVQTGWHTTIEQDFAINAEICLLVDDLRYRLVVVQLESEADMSARKRGAA